MITPIYACALTVLFICLSARVITYRRGNKIGLGDSGDNSLLKRMRAQANCAEYAPLGVVLMVLAELQQAPAMAIHVIGLLLLSGRLMHGIGFSLSPPIMRLRVWGMMLTFASFLAAIGVILISYI